MFARSPHVRLAALVTAMVPLFTGVAHSDDMATEVSNEAAGAAAAMPAAMPAKTGSSGPAAPPMGGKVSRDLKFDWMQHKNGEWLKGSFDMMENGDFYFDSDEFGKVKIGWGDLETFVTKGPISIRMEDGSTHTGQATLSGGRLILKKADGKRAEVDPGQVMMIISGTLSEWNFWGGDASLGLSWRQGNTDQLDLTLRAGLSRRTTLTRFHTRYVGEVSTVSGDTTANSHRVPSQLDVFVTPRLFVTPAYFEFFTDEFQNIDTRLSAGAGLGYEVYDNGWFYWEVGSVVGYQWTSFSSVISGDNPENDGVVGFNTKANFDFPHGIEWDNLYQVNVTFTDMDKTNHHAESVLSFDIWGPLEFETTFIFDRVEQPREDAAGNRPESNDYRLTAGIGVDF